MNERTIFDRQIGAYLEARSTTRAPAELLEATLARVGATRQRPWWRLIGRRLRHAMAARWTAPVEARVVFALIALIALAIVALAVAGSHSRLPPPFGPARPGALTVEVGGDIGIARPDGTGLTMLTSGPEIDSYPTYSPDGTRIAFTSQQQDLSWALEVMDSDGGHRMALAQHLLPTTEFVLAESIGLSWSPDSRHIAVAARVAEAPESRLLIADVDLAGVTQLGGPEVYGISPSWSPDGTLIAFKRIYPCCGGPPDTLWLIGADGSGLRQLSSATGTREALMRTAWSPDSRRLAFLAPGNERNNDIYVINVDGTGEQDITDTPDDELWPCWSPDGTRIAFSRVEIGTNAAARPGTFIVDPDGSRLVELPETIVDVTTAFWSPDGSRVLGFDDGLVSGSGDAIAILDPSGRTAPIVIHEPRIGSVSWQRLAP